ncbi:uncharacterized protein BX663DRAFT_531537 [Cokeromyces recurvatus]|uniref:uncharacterized protein n=1 Tax=Cokeromyces recurvatus TaxID=90255 RepID=UPI0022209392|nr:uncharacterized protein BX663DRAFT_531537 [Cokeromyces recurvatus]KAI7902221.1 hypothetical protein BX663DRAFT_531537 [Cokeromyces recurvatus]
MTATASLTLTNSDSKKQSTQTDEKYLTFFTHSGFQNQLIQVENGILLAWYLNRTLILPKALLGEAFGWNPFYRLELHHKVRDTANNDCKQFKDKKSRKLASCPDPLKYTLASFDDLFDLSWAKRHINIIEREQSDFDWLQTRFGIKRDILNSKNKSQQQATGVYIDRDILFFKDKTRYDWRIYDVPVKNPFLGKYTASLDVSQLKNYSQKLIHFTSLFGTGKFPIKKSENIEFFKSLQKSMTYKHPAVLKITDVVVELLGGAGNYVGVHLRTADGLFVKELPENIQYVINHISTLSFSSKDNLSNYNHYSLSECVLLAKANQTTLVFLATDAIRSRMDKRFHHLWSHLPCTFTLDEILEANNPIWSHMDKYRTSHTGESMRKYLIPLVDALVASKGVKFVGTKGSTFSGYIHRLHQNYWSST